MERLFLTILHMSLISSYIILVVLLLRRVLRRAPKLFSYLLWAVVFVRLICPWTVQGSFSLIPEKLVGASIESMQDNLTGRHQFVEKTDSADGNQTYEAMLSAGADSDRQVEADRNTLDDNRVEAGGIRGKLAAAIGGITAKAVTYRGVILFGCGIFWILGVAVVFVWQLTGVLRLRHQIKSAKNVGADVYECADITTSFVYGCIHPTIYLPKGLSEYEKRYIICHEQVHIARKDYLIRPLAFLITGIHWFNPLVWIAFGKMCCDMEMSCDEQVLRQLGMNIKKDYSQSILAFAMGEKVTGAVPLAFGAGNVRERINNVLTYKKARLVEIVTLAVFLAAVVAALLINPGKKEAEQTGRENLISDASTETEQIMSTEQPSGQNLEIKWSTPEELADSWASAFSVREGEAIYSLLAGNWSKDEKRAFYEKMDMGYIRKDGSLGFGESSPWPMEDNARIRVDTAEKKIDILYFVQTAEPHITVWRETLSYISEEAGKSYAVVSEELKKYDMISSLQEFEEAYELIGDFDGSMMDYQTNGCGENLENHAMLDSSNKYRALFDPVTAAQYLMNLSAGNAMLESMGERTATVWYGFGNDYALEIYMVKPNDGIWYVDGFSRFDSGDMNETTTMTENAGFLPLEEPDEEQQEKEAQSQLETNQAAANQAQAELEEQLRQTQKNAE